MYNIKQETSYLLEVYDEYAFFVKKNYKVFYPNVSADLKNKLISNPRAIDSKSQLETELRPIFKQEERIYTQTISKVKTGWRGIENNFLKELNKLQLDVDGEIKCYISRYGPGGSFNPYKSITVRAIMEYKPDMIGANEKIAHELVHLAIHKHSRKYRLGFENTERLVDLILTRTPITKLLNSPTLQGFGDNRLDTFFDLHPSDAEKVISEFSFLIS